MNNKTLEKIMISPEISIKKTIAVIDDAAKQIALVVDKEAKLLGTVTDGDIRRGIISDIDMDSSVREIMNKDFFSLHFNTPKDEILAAFKQKNYHQIPLVDDQGQVKDLAILNEIIKEKKKRNKVVLMVGGLGSRLRPLTEDTPKPLLSVGGKPIMETIIEQFKSYGFYNFILCTNYKAGQIKNYFGSGTELDIEIEYVNEEKRLGTAGALSLIEEDFEEPFFVMNGDLLTRLNFDSMMKYHKEDGFKMTIGSREYNYQIPYGVVQIDNQKVHDLVEKPNHNVFVNAGVYILEPELLDLIPYNEFYDMTDLINELLQKDKPVGAFPIREYWADIGQHEDYMKAKEEYWDQFSEVASAEE